MPTLCCMYTCTEQVSDEPKTVQYVVVVAQRQGLQALRGWSGYVRMRTDGPNENTDFLLFGGYGKLLMHVHANQNGAKHDTNQKEFSRVHTLKWGRHIASHIPKHSP